MSAVKRGDYPAAIRLFQEVVAKDDQNADAYNWLAYSTRKSWVTRPKAILIYEKALAINPKHRALTNTSVRLSSCWAIFPRRRSISCSRQAVLVALRGVPDLKKAVRDYESSGGRVKPASTSN